MRSRIPPCTALSIVLRSHGAAVNDVRVYCCWWLDAGPQQLLQRGAVRNRGASVFYILSAMRHAMRALMLLLDVECSPHPQIQVFSEL